MSIRETAFFDLEDELNATRHVLERLPDGRFDWRPHERSWTLGELATHVASLPWWMLVILDDDGFDVGAGQSPETRTDADAVIEFFDANAAALRDAFARATDEILRGPWQLRHGESVIFELSKSVVLRRWGLSHLVHHRAQLTVYLRQLDVPLPPLYGPTADEQ
ncbi:MAG: hypothetical protein HKN17_07885 [Rhodothermales bacterium]|nr:hypothetical protein [Rhodothermales bacterium]